MKMNPEIKHEWTELLRSGEIKQGAGRLQNPDGGMCCFGVLCELYRRKTGKGEWRRIEMHSVDFYLEGSHGDPGADDARFYPPAQVLEWAGIPREAWTRPEADTSGVELAQGLVDVRISLREGRVLDAVNDKIPDSFELIAGLIDRGL